MNDKRPDIRNFCKSRSDLSNFNQKYCLFFIFQPLTISLSHPSKKHAELSEVISSKLECSVKCAPIYSTRIRGPQIN